MSDDGVILKQDFRCAPEGHTLVTYKQGTLVTGEVARLARDAKVAEAPRQADARKPRAPTETK